MLAQANPTAEDFLPAAFLNAQQVYQVNGETVSGQLLRQLGLRKPYQFNAVNHGTAQVTGDFQSFVYQLQAKKRSRMMSNQLFDQQFMHGGDYNPDQWLAYPENLAKGSCLHAASPMSTLSH